MGVPGLFPYVRKRFPHHYQRYPSQSSPPKPLYVDYVHVDGNAMVHPCSQVAFNYGPGGRKGMDPYASLTYQQRMELTFNLFWRELINLVQVYRPSVLDITLDGPAPLAKQNQQRDRRFGVMASADPGTVAASADPKKPSVDAPKKFNSTQISPGTLFMLELTKFLNFQIRKYVNGPWSDMTIIFSSCQVPGEGEHKIINFIRSLPLEEQNKKHLIVGDDGDLIFLTMATRIPQMFLLRNDTDCPGFKYLLAISDMVTSGLPKFFGLRSSETKEAVDEFIFIGFFVGNDFLPMIPMFVLLKDGLDRMIETLESNQFKLIDSQGRINFDDFRSFVGILAQLEPEYLAAEVKNFEEWNPMPGDDGQVVDKEMFRNATLEKHYDRKSNQLDYDSFRISYLQKVGIADESGRVSKTKIKEWCHDYIKTLIWVFQYYTKGLPSWEWYYPYHYPPLMADLAEYVDDVTAFLPTEVVKNTRELYAFDRGEPSLPFVQLLSILPSTASENLPPAYRHLMTSALSPLVEAGYYPAPPYKVDYEGKRKAHAGIVLIKHVDDVGAVRKAYSSVAKRDPNDYARNQLNKSKKFVRELEEPYRYDGDYGTVRECYVKVEDVE